MRTRIELFDIINKGSVGAELGVFKGSFSEEIAYRIDPTKQYAVDLWAGEHTSGDKDGANIQTVNLSKVYDDLAHRWLTTPVEIVRSESTSWLWSQPEGTLDWVYIDTQHTWFQLSHELAAARYAVKKGGLIMGHDFCPWTSPGVVRAVREFASRWKCDIEVTSDDLLPSFRMINPGISKDVVEDGIVVQLAVGDKCQDQLKICRGEIANWAYTHGWRYESQTTNPTPYHPEWYKVIWLADLLEKNKAVIMMDTDVILADASIHPGRACEAPGLGMAVTGREDNAPHHNAGFIAARAGHPQTIPMLRANWLSREKMDSHPWREQHAYHELALHFPDPIYTLSPIWNSNFIDRHLSGCVNPVFLSYHGLNNRIEQMKKDIARLQVITLSTINSKKMLVLIPLKPNMPASLRDRCISQAESLKLSLGSFVDVKIDERGSGDADIKRHGQRQVHVAKIRQELIEEHLKPHHTGVLLIDADVRYDVDVVKSLMAYTDAVVAPMVMMESKDSLGVFQGTERFYDTKGFIENGKEAPIAAPFFKQNGPIVDLDSVGAFYLVPADVFRAGAKYAPVQGYTEHYAICKFAKKMGKRVICDTRLKVYHPHLPEYDEAQHESSVSDSLNPLENLSRFSISMRVPISLPAVSVVVETRQEMMPRIREIIEWHRRFFKFHREIIVSNVNPNIPGTTFVNCGALPSADKMMLWYSDMCVHALAGLCDAPFMLTWQWDGFILNPERWSDDFLKWDYIGAPLGGKWQAASLWFEQNIPGWQNPYKTTGDTTLIAGHRVLTGNGGFSLRSKKFLDASNSLSRTGWASYVEDMYLCLERRKELEDKGIKFCPAEIAKYFSSDSAVEPPLEDLFGFHSRDNLAEVKQYLEAKYLTSPVPVSQIVSPEGSVSALVGVNLL